MDLPDTKNPVERGPAWTLAEEYGLRYVESITDEMLDSSLVVRLPVDWARVHSLLPVTIDGEACVLTADPSQIQELQYLELLLDTDLTPVVAEQEAIASAIEQCYYSREDSAEDFLRALESEGDGEGGDMRKSEDLLQISEGAPVSQLVNLILLEAVKGRASDIHFEPFEDKLRVRYRIDGRLYNQACPPKHLEMPLVSRLKVMAKMDIAERRLPQDGMARVRVGEREIDVRVSTVPVAEGERVVLRLLDRDASLLPVSSLGMDPEMFGVFNGVLSQSHGLILVTGPTGSGKTTTLYAALGGLDSAGLNIMTIEDPIEYQIQGIGQMQVKPKIGLTFASGLRHILRQDPDVILVGETRDTETAETAARSSLTGHLVFTTLHTNDAPSAIVRMIDVGVEPYLLSASLRAVLAQRLVRQLCTSCREQVPAEDRDISALGEAGEGLSGKMIWQPTGCPECLGGYRGRLGIFELMKIDSDIQECVRVGKCSVSEMQGMARKKGMRTLVEDGAAKVAAGTTSLAEVLRVLGKVT